MWPNVRDFYTFSPFVFLPSSFSTAFNLAMSLKIKTFLDILKAKSAFFNRQCIFKLWVFTLQSKSTTNLVGEILEAYLRVDEEHSF